MDKPISTREPDKYTQQTFELSSTIEFIVQEFRRDSNTTLRLNIYNVRDRYGFWIEIKFDSEELDALPFHISSLAICEDFMNAMTAMKTTIKSKGEDFNG